MRMLNRTLILLLIVALFPLYSVADEYPALTVHEGYVENERETTNNTARAVDLAHGLMDALGGKYDSSQSAIAAGNTQTVASAFGVSVHAFAAAASGGATVTWSGIVAVVTSGLKTAAEKEAALTAIGGTSLVDAYSSAEGIT